MLELKTEVKELFKAAGVPELTVGSIDGYLNIVGSKCGEAIMSIAQFKVGTKFSTKQREIIIEEYLEPVLVKYGKELKDLVAVKKAGKLIDEAIEVEIDSLRKMDIKVSVEYNYNDNQSYYTCTIDLGKDKGSIVYTPNEKNPQINLRTKSELKDIPTISAKATDLVKLTKSLAKLESKQLANIESRKVLSEALAIKCGW